MTDPTLQTVELAYHGYPELRVDGRAIRLTLLRGLALLCLLAETDGVVSREHAAALLWPEADLSTGRARLRRLIHEVNSRCGLELLAGDLARLHVARGIELVADAPLTRQAARLLLAGGTAARDQVAVSAVLHPSAGTLLHGFRLASDAFSDWMARRRAEHENLLAAALLKLTQGAAEDDPALAVAAAERAVAVDPCNERAWLAVIAGLLRLGQRSSAEAARERCERALRRELGTRPSVAFDEACEALLRGRARQDVA